MLKDSFSPYFPRMNLFSTAMTALGRLLSLEETNNTGATTYLSPLQGKKKCRSDLLLID